MRLTPAGQWMIALGIGLGLLLAWTGAGLTQLVVAIAVALLVLAPAIAALHARGLTLVAPEGKTVFAGRAFDLDLLLRNRFRLLTARDLFLSFVEPGRTEPVLAGYVPACGPRQTIRLHTQHGRLDRGRHHTVQVIITSTYPFGLAVARLSFEVPVDVLVLPRLGTLVQVDRLVAPAPHLAPRGPSGPWGEDEFRGLREWREGESLRRVHWKVTARRGRRVIREFEGTGRARVHIVVSTVLPKRILDGPVSGSRDLAKRSGAFELAISFAGTMAEHYLRRRHPVRLSVIGSHPKAVASRQGRSGLFPILSALADVEPELAGEPLPLRVGRDEMTIVVSLHGPELMVQGRAFNGRNPGCRWLDVRKPAVRRMFHRARSAGAANPLAWRW